MNRLLHRLEALQKEKRESARLGCLHIEHLRRNLRPEVLDQLQHGLRMGTLDIEARIREWEDRRLRRAAAIRRFRKRYGGSPKIGEHLTIVEIYAEELAHLRLLLRQLGDACAWTVLRLEPRLIAPLFARRTHRLTAGRSLTSATQMIMDAHATGRFFAIDNDLTRCIGDGDVTVVRAGKPWALPVTYELKSPESEVVEADGTVTINFLAALTNHPDQVALHEEFASALFMNEGTKGRTASSLERQRQGMERRAKVLLAVTRPREHLPRRKSYWETIRTVISRAQQFGTAFDEPERGLVYAALRLRPNEDTIAMMSRMLERLKEHVPRGEPLLTTDDFKSEDSYSAVMPPIALWPLPLEQRSALLAGEVLLGCVFRSDIFDDAFREAGLILERDKAGAWRVSGNGEPIVFDSLEVAKLRLGIALNAMSPRELAQVCAEQMKGPA
jgi:hypothetical protein